MILTGRDDAERHQSADSTRSEVSGSAHEVIQARDVHGGVHFHGSSQPPWTVPPRQLPADVRGFVNRITELERLDRVLAGDPQHPMTGRLSVIVGTAGVGKTSLAVHWAHRIRDHFPDGQLYVNLRGYDPGLPVEPAQALDHLLRALDVPPAAIPADLDAKASLFRSLLADRRILLVLDNAATASQVRPLLPGTAGCLTVVTSRSRLSGLVFRDGAHRVTIEMLTEQEAVTLLRIVTADYRAEDDTGQLAELARLCARLPLALRIAAERAARRPRTPLDELIQDLRNESALWDALSADDDEEADAVRTVFAWSYRALADESARIFRLLGLHPGSDFCTAAAAALIAVDIGQARYLLDVLVGNHLLELNPPDRYHFHDLLRIYANDQARQEETIDNRRAALRRVVTWYLHGADALQAATSPLSPRVQLDPLPTGVPVVRFADAAEANLWYIAERVNLVAVARAAAEEGMDDLAWRLGATLHHSYRNLNPFDDWFTTTSIGLAAARRIGEKNAEAELLESLATVCVQTHRFAESVEHFRSSLAIRRELNDRQGEAVALNGLGLLYLRQRALVDARTSFEGSLRIVRELGDVYWQAVVEANLGAVHQESGDLETALTFVRHAMDVYENLSDSLGQGDALNSLSMIYRELGRPDEALQLIDRAIAIARERGNTVWEGYWLVELGEVKRAINEPAEALIHCQRAATIQRQTGDRIREAQALDGTGLAYADLARFEEAADFHRLAVAAYHELDDRWLLAIALNNLAVALHLTGGVEEAARHWRSALASLDGFDDLRAARLRERIRAALTI